MESVEQPRLRWRTVLWTQSRPGGGRFSIQVGQNLLDNRWVFNTGNDLDLTGTALAGLDVDVEHSLEPLHPGHRHMALVRRLVQPVSPGRLPRPAPPAPLGRRHPHTKLAIGCEHPVKTRQICAWLWHQGSHQSVTKCLTTWTGRP